MYTREELDRLPEVSRKQLEVYKYKSDVYGKYIVLPRCLHRGPERF